MAIQNHTTKFVLYREWLCSRFSYSAVHFALCHIYSGASNIPDSINIVELATLADMLCLEGLKEVIMYTLKVKYCHFFHKVINHLITLCLHSLVVQISITSVYTWSCIHPTLTFKSFLL